MAQTLRQAMFRAREDLYACLVPCLECGAPRGTRCRNLRGRPVITCCGIRADLARPMVLAIVKMILLLREHGWTPEIDDLPVFVALDIAHRAAGNGARP